MHLIVVASMKKLQLVLIIITFILTQSYGQDVSKLNVGFGHGFGLPAADLSDRYGEAWSSTLGLYYHMYKSDIIIGVEASTFYGKTFDPDGLRDSGLKIGLGAGFMSHHIRIQDDTQNSAYFQGDYVYGFNRYSFGPALKQFVGYHYANAAFNYNFSIGLEVEEGFTQSRRAVDFGTGLPDESSRVDVLTTLKARFYLALGSYGNTDSILY